MKVTVLVWLLSLIPVTGFSEPQIKHFFPERPSLLGQPLFWIIELRHSLWESYELKFGSCPDLKMSIADKRITDVAGEIRVLYKVAVAPTVLNPSCTPNLMISDEKGQTTVLNGKPLLVQKISGDSEQIKTPVLPVIARKSSHYYTILFSLLAILAVFCLILAGKRVYANLPEQRYLRDIRKAEMEVRQGRLPIQVWRLLRSKIVWGFEAEAYTPAQLHQKGADDIRLRGIAATLQSLEAWRYCGSSASWNSEQVTQALGHAKTLVESKSSLLPRRRS